MDSDPSRAAYWAGRQLAQAMSVDPAQATVPYEHAAEAAAYRQGIEDEQRQVVAAWPEGPAAQPVPADTLDRVFEAAKRSVDYVPGQARAQFAQLMTTDTLWALAIIVGVWAGLQFLPVGALVDVIMVAMNGWLILSVAGHLKDAVMLAADARSQAELDLAAKALAAVWVEIGIDSIAALVGSAAFRKLRSAILKIKPPRAGRPVAAAEPAPRPTEPAPRPVAPAPPGEPLGRPSPPRAPEPARPRSMGEPAPEPVAEPARRPTEAGGRSEIRAGEPPPSGTTASRYGGIRAFATGAVIPTAARAGGTVIGEARQQLSSAGADLSSALKLGVALAAGGSLVIVTGAVLLRRK